MLVGADLHMAGYSRDRVPVMEKRMVEAIAAIPGVQSVGLTDALLLNDQITSSVYRDQTTDVRPANAALGDVYMYHVSPDYLHAEGITLVSGRSFTWDDGKDSPRVGIVNKEFASRIFGSVQNAIGGYFKLPDGTACKWLVSRKTENTANSPKRPSPRCFCP
jgi:hypothetical protein